MRVTLHDRVLYDRYESQPLDSSWWVEDDGLAGWYEAPAPRAESDDVPDGDGGYWPAEFHVAQRHPVLRGVHVAQTSTLARAEAEAWLASLPGRFLFAVDDEHGYLELEVFQSAQPAFRRLNSRASAFTFTATAPDATKYGRPTSFSGAWVENAGRTGVLPWQIIAGGPVTSILVVLNGHRIRWVGSATDVAIDTRVGTATAVEGDVTTGLVEDDIPLLPPGRTPMLIMSDAPVRVEVRPGWR